jgi:long-subunit acyl-CoA synthetase (AMP-forming)
MTGEGAGQIMTNKRIDPEFSARKITDLKDMIVTSTDHFPENDAYLYKDKKAGRFVPIKYSRVRHDMDALGTKLIDMGLKGEKIAVMGETSYYWILTYFATVCGVGIVVPLDKNLPEGELRGLISRSGASAIAYSDKMRKTVEPLIRSKRDGSDEDSPLRYFISTGEIEENTEDECSIKALIREGEQLLANGDRRFIDAQIDPDQVSTLLFTSGTTGMAKGVLLTHKNLTSNVYEMSKYFHIPEPGIVLSILPIHHVYEMTCDIMTTFYQGKTIAICEGIKYIQKDMVEVKANVMLGVPLVFEKMYKGMWKQAKRRGEDEKLRRAIDLSKKLKLYKNQALCRKLFSAIHNSFGGNIKYFIVGGAAADPFIIEEFEAMGLPMLQGYGMSENSPIIAMNSDKYRKPDAAGKPLPGTTVKVDSPDEDGIGELIVKGPSVMKGYYQNEEATKETLRDGWLYTGDLGFIDDEGYVHITGRNKTVIVTKGGKNIFPEEVEDVLMKNDYIQEVIVHGVKDTRIGNVIVTADIYPDHDKLKEAGVSGDSEIYHFMRDVVDDINDSMPPYKQVKRINIRKEPFIKTTSGKIRRYGNDVVDTASGPADWHEARYVEEKAASKTVEKLKNSQDPYICRKDLTPVTDIRSLLQSSAAKYAEKTAFIQRYAEGNVNGDSCVEITYQHAMSDIEGLGTAMMNRDLSDRRIAVMGDSSYEWQITFLAVAGGVGVIVPIDVSAEDDEIVRRLEESEVSVIFTSGKYLSRFRQLIDQERIKADLVVYFGEGDELSEEINIMDEENKDKDKKESRRKRKREHAREETPYVGWHDLVEEGKKAISLGDRQYLDKETLGSDPAAIVYTSGATGTPKGVYLTAGNIVSDVMGTEAMLDIKDTDVVYSVIPMHNMYEITCGLLLPLYCGAAVASAEDDDSTIDGIQFEMCNIKPTVFIGTPWIIGAMKNKISDNVDRLGGNGLRFAIRANRFTKKIGVDVMGGYMKEILKNFGGRLRLVVSGGASADSETLSVINDAGITAVQGYGLTECSPVVAVNPANSRYMKNGSCGRIIPGVEVKVEGRDSSSVGEIYVKGPNVSPGYYNDKELTAVSMDDEGWFRTGDMGFVDDDRFLYITGRRSSTKL